MKRILFLTQGDRLVPSSRHRAILYIPYLEKAGFEVVLHPAVTAEEYHDGFIARSWASMMQRGFRSFTRRIKDLHEIRDFHFIFIQKPILPAPLFNMELRFAQQAKMIFDFDDAIYLKKPGGFLPANCWPQANRIAGVCRNAYKVVVANPYLAQFVHKQGVTPLIQPTALDTESFALEADKPKRPSKIPVVGWVGSPSTQPELELVIPSLIDLHSRAPFVVRLFGAHFSSMPVRFPIEWKPWRLETEASDISHLDVGLAPMRETPWNLGKSGLKVLQYWAAGVPVVASPVGIYKEIIRDGDNGLLASSRSEWCDKILTLMKDPSLRKKLIQGGRRTVEENYSLKVLAPRFLKIFEEKDPEKS